MSTVQLMSQSHLKDGGAGRANFEIRMQRGFSGCRRYQVLGFAKGFLLLDLGAGNVAGGQMTGALVGGILGGAVGAALGRAVGESLEAYGDSEVDYSRKTDEQLLEIARRSHHSLVVSFDEIESVSVDAAGVLGNLTRGGSLIGMITIREKTLGKLRMEVHDILSMAGAIESFPAEIQDRVQVNVEFDSDNCMYRRKRS